MQLWIPRTIITFHLAKEGIGSYSGGKNIYYYKLSIYHYKTHDKMQYFSRFFYVLLFKLPMNLIMYEEKNFKCILPIFV